MSQDEETPWHRPLFVAAGALLGVAVLVGGVISVVALGAVNLAGLGEDPGTVRAQPTLHIPERTPGTSRDDDPGLTLEDLNGGVDRSAPEAPEVEPEESRSPRADKKRKRRPARSVISLSASPLEVARMERIFLTGTYPRGEGASLQVQRFEAGWTDFPTSTSVSGGTFSTYVMTGQPGANRFRVVDSGSGKKSNPVTIRVR